MRAALRKGWCPSVLRPMASGDGLIVRVSLNNGRLSPVLARALARCAHRFGNGLFDLSARANLQLRGVNEATLSPLQSELRALGLAETEEAPSVARSVLVSPLAGIDPQAILDIGPYVELLRDRLTRETILHALPAKFGFIVDDGGALSLASEKTDVSFLARRRGGVPHFLISLAGRAAGECAIDDLADAGLRIALAFLELRDGPMERMAGLVRRIGVAAIAGEAGLIPTTETPVHDRTPTAIGAYRVGGHHVLGLGVPFGRLDAATLERLADIAEAGRGELRLTPWRAILVVATTPPDAASLADTALIFSEDDPLRAVAACPGAPDCTNATTSTHEDARRLAPFARRLRARGISVHVSGCTKGCAHPRKAPVTFIGRDGHYDLVLDGTAADAPIAAGLSGAQLNLALQRLVAKIDA